MNKEFFQPTTADRNADTELIPKESSIENKYAFGENVELTMKFLRHGDRDPYTNLLTDFGREETKRNAQATGLIGKDLDLVKGLGSTVGPFNDAGEGRALETADIYARTIAGESADGEGRLGVTRPTEVMSYEQWVSPVPYDHKPLYNSFLPENFTALSPIEKADAATVAQTKITEHLLSLDSEEARAYKMEAAGSLAFMIMHYLEIVPRLKSGSKTLIPDGGHGPVVELLLQKALIRTDEDGKEIRGFKQLKEIGGPQKTSEAVSVRLATGKNKKIETLALTFDDPSRPDFGEMRLDLETVRELANYYASLHPESVGSQHSRLDGKRESGEYLEGI